MSGILVSEVKKNNKIQEENKMKNWEAIVNLMDDEIREQVHMELAPCTDEEFLARYLELDPEFESVLNEFSESDD